jgi:hypothetical protein
LEGGNKMHYYDIKTSETEKLWNRWVSIEKYNVNFSRLIRGIIQNSGKLSERDLERWTTETKVYFSDLKVEISQKATNEVRELIKETYQYILSKKVEIQDDSDQDSVDSIEVMEDANEQRIKVEYYKTKLKKVLDGIDKAMYDLTNEDTSRPEVIEQIHGNLIDIYNEGMNK